MSKLLKISRCLTPGSASKLPARYTLSFLPAIRRALRIHEAGILPSLFEAEDGGAREDRTPDLLRARQALSQLSYGPFLLVFFA